MKTDECSPVVASHANGNLARRTDLNQSGSCSGVGYAGKLCETFVHDSLDRLDTVSRNGTLTLDVDYDLTGNITQRSDVGVYGYHATRKHAVVTAGTHSYGYDANGNVTGRNGVAQTWASYDLPTTLAGNGWQSQFWYGPGRNRWKQVATSSGGTVTTTYVAGLLEKVVRGGLTEWRHAVVTPTGLAAVYSRRSDGSADTYYLTADHLGSTDRVVRAVGGLVQVAASFGAFGARRGSDWSGSPSTSDWTAIGNTTRNGFTGHEHLDNVQLIHMNGRVYDPVVGRFLSVDPIVDPGYGQDLNGYSYVWNNPLAVTDPSGWDEVPPTLPTVPVTQPRLWTYLDTWFYWREVRSRLQVTLGNVDPCGPDGNANDCNGNSPDDDLQNEDSRSPQGSQLENAVCRAGNAVAQWAGSLGSASGKVELAGLGIAGIGFVTARPEVTVPGLAMAAAGGVGNIGSGVMQFGAGLLQGAGGGGFSNSGYAALSLVTGLVLARGITGPTVSGYRTVSQRAGDAFRNGTATTVGGVNDAWTSLIDAAAPRQVTCPGGN